MKDRHLVHQASGVGLGTHICASLEEQHFESGLREIGRERSSASSRSYDDVIEVSAVTHRSHLASEGLEKFDESSLVTVTESRLIFVVTGSEVVTTIHDEIGALAQLEQRVEHVLKYLAALLVGRSSRQIFQVALYFYQYVKQLLVVVQSLNWICTL